MTTATFPRWTLYIAPLAALWYGFGLSQAVIGYMADASAAPLAIWASYAVACLAGVVGSAALFFRPARAATAFAVSLAAAVIYFGWVFMFGSPASEDYGIGAMVMAITFILMMVSRRLS